MKTILNENIEAIASLSAEIPSESLTLTELLDRVGESVSEEFPGDEWVVCQISSISDRQFYCFMDVVETDGAGAIIAQARANIWRNNYFIIKSSFEQAAGSSLKPGMKVLMRCRVQFDKRYGLSLVVNDIDAAFTLGEAEAERRRTIARLTDAGLMDRNKELALPRLPRRFAIISSSTAAGYGDFMKQLHNNPADYSFQTMLFEAPMQGDSAPAGIVAAMEKVMTSMELGAKFDALLIMRGGGSASDLSCFDDFGLCSAIANCGLPVITAVGHDRDFHICDMVAAVSVKTPTAAADYLLDIYSNEDECLDDFYDRLARAFRGKAKLMEHELDSIYGGMASAVKLRVSEERHRLAIAAAGVASKAASRVEMAKRDLQMLSERISSASKLKVSAGVNWLDRIQAAIQSGLNMRLAAEMHRLEKCDLRLAANPIALLGRGQAILEGPKGRMNGIGDVEVGDAVVVTMKDGFLDCTVNGKREN